MKTYSVIFTLFIALLGIVVAILLQSAPDSVSGNSHPSFPSMSQGGDASRHDGIWVLGWLFGALQIILFCGLYLGEPLWSEDSPMGGDPLWSGLFIYFHPCS